jgi:hypothetical protein
LLNISPQFAIISNVRSVPFFPVLFFEFRPNVFRFHDAPSGSGRVPQLQEWISLVGDRAAGLPGESWACVVTLLNQDALHTIDWLARIDLFVEGHLATCRIAEDRVSVDFSGSRPARGGGGME